MLSLELVWDIADIAMAGMALVNLTACTLLLRWVLGALRDYEHRMRTGTPRREVRRAREQVPAR